MDQSKLFFRDKLLSSLLSDENEAELDALREQLYEEFPVLQNISGCRVAILSLDLLDAELRERYAYRYDLLIFTLLNLCNDHMQQSRCGVAFRCWQSAPDIILLLWDRLDELLPLIAEINEHIALAYGAQFDYGIGREHSFPAEAVASYNEARFALRHRNLLEAGGRIVFYGPELADAEQPIHLTDYEESLRRAVRSGKPEHVAPAVQLVFDVLEQLDRITVEQLELWGHEYKVLKARWLADFSREEQSGMGLPSEQGPFIVPMDEHGRISLKLWQTELTNSLTRLARRVQERSQSGNTMQDIVRYIDTHYAMDLTLQQLADHFYLSREYISRKFKSLFDENLVDYIARTRIDKSKSLLLNSALKISDVAQAVGYQDEKYFSKVFKKREGVSPNEYRKTMKLLESVESN